MLLFIYFYFQCAFKYHLKVPRHRRGVFCLSLLLGRRAQLCDICFDFIMKDRKKGKLISGLTTEDKISFLRTHRLFRGV